MVSFAVDEACDLVMNSITCRCKSPPAATLSVENNLFWGGAWPLKSKSPLKSKGKSDPADAGKAKATSPNKQKPLKDFVWKDKEHNFFDTW